MLRYLAVLLCSPVLAFGQASNSQLSGTVRDSSAAVIAGAKLTLTNSATNFQFNAVTNEAGFYLFPGILPGPYLLEAAAPGMEPWRVTLTAQTAQKYTIDPVLKAGATNASIQVTDATPMVNLTDSTLSRVIQKEQVEQLPRTDRTLLSLMVTVPGVEGGGRRSAGLRYGSAEFQLDGVPLVSRSRGEIQYRQPGLDSVEEVGVENNNVSAKHNSPVAVIARTKSGTNELHGSLFETHTNSRVGGARTREATNAAAPFANRGQFGGSVGGPVILPKLYHGKNKTFFFTAYEATRRLANSVVNYSVPTAAMRNGDFSGLVDAANRPIAIYDPFSTDSNTFARQRFNYGGKANAIDPARMSPLWKSLMELTPLPTLPDVNPLLASNWFGNAATIQRDWTYSLRLDHRFSDKDLVYARYSKNYYLNDGPFAGAVPLNTNSANRNAFAAPSQSLALSWVRTISPTLFLETLATVESNESLETYAVAAPIAGVVTARNANPGEQTGERVLFTVADLSTVWVEVSLFPRDVARVRTGQGVQVRNAETGQTAAGRVVYVAPFGSSSTQTLIARVQLDNADRRWPPGLYVTAAVTLATSAVPVAVRSAALQTLEDRPVAFVRTADGFVPRVVRVGRSDGERTEILDGIAAGESYAAANSFVLKAELGKGEAEHED